MEARKSKEIDFSSADTGGGQEGGSTEEGGYPKIQIDSEELLNVVVKSSIGGLASAWAVKKSLGDD